MDDAVAGQECGLSVGRSGSGCGGDDENDEGVDDDGISILIANERDERRRGEKKNWRVGQGGTGEIPGSTVGCPSATRTSQVP